MHVVVLASKYDRKDSLSKVKEIMEEYDENRVILCHILKLNPGTKKKSLSRMRSHMKNDYNLSEECDLEKDTIAAKFAQAMTKSPKPKAKPSSKTKKRSGFKKGRVKTRSNVKKSFFTKKQKSKAAKFVEGIIKSSSSDSSESSDTESDGFGSISDDSAPVARRTRS